MYPLGTWSVDGILSGVFGSASLRRLALARMALTIMDMRQLGRVLLPDDVLCRDGINRIGHLGRTDQTMAVSNFHHRADSCYLSNPGQWKWGVVSLIDGVP